MSMRTHRLLGWWLVALLLAAGFASLGRWQLARMHEKRVLLADAARALDHAHPQPLRLASDHRRRQAFDWSAGQGWVADAVVWLDNQQRQGRVGVRRYCVLLPEAGTQAVLVDTGWWPLDGARTLPEIGCRAHGIQRVRGLLAPPPSEGLVHGAALARQRDGTWLVARMDLPDIARALRLPAGIAPRVLRLDPVRLPGDGGMMSASGARDLDILPNTLTPERHLGYAVQWFGLALAVLVVALVLTLRKKTSNE